VCQLADSGARYLSGATAAMIIDEYSGSLDEVVLRPEAEAKRALRRIRGIADPGAEKILLLTRSRKILALESNGLRVLLRVGYGQEGRNYTATYKSVREAVDAEVIDDFDWLIDAHVLLRHHGQQVCKTSVPHCETCVLTDVCDFYSTRRPK
jgi:endonuclease III